MPDATKDESETMIDQALSTDVRRRGEPVPIETGAPGPAIRFPLNEMPDRDWRKQFGSWGGLRDHFAQIRFDDNDLLLFFKKGSSASAIEPALDEVEHAIAHANDHHRAEVARSRERSKEFGRKQAEESVQIEHALDAWTQKRTA